MKHDEKWDADGGHHWTDNQGRRWYKGPSSFGRVVIFVFAVMALQKNWPAIEPWLHRQFDQVVAAFAPPPPLPEAYWRPQGHRHSREAGHQRYPQR